MLIPEKYLATIRPFIDQAKVFLEAGQQLHPMVILGSFDSGAKTSIMLGPDDEDAALSIRMAAKHLNADFVFLITEAWGLPRDKVPFHADIIEQY